MGGVPALPALYSPYSTLIEHGGHLGYLRFGLVRIRGLALPGDGGDAHHVAAAPAHPAAVAGDELHVPPLLLLRAPSGVFSSLNTNSRNDNSGKQRQTAANSIMNGRNFLESIASTDS